MKRKVLIIGTIGVVVAGSLIAIGVHEQSGAEAQLKRARESARRVGIPLTLSEFNTAYPAPPEAENAWPLYREAIEIAHPGALDASRSPDSPLPRTRIDDLLSNGRSWRRGQFEANLDEDSRTQLRNLGPMFERLREASHRPRLYLAKDWTAGVMVELPEVTEFSRLARLAILDASAAAVEGDLDRFVDRLEIVSGMARHLGRAPFPAGPIMAFNFGSSVADAVQQHVSTGRIGGASLGRLQALVSRLNQDLDPRPGIRAYTWMLVASLNVLSSREKIREHDVENRFAMRNVPKPEVQYETEQRILADVAAILGRWPEDREDTLGMRSALGDEDLDIRMALLDFSPYFRTGPRNEPVTEGAFSRMLESYENFLARKRLCLCLLEILGNQSRTGRFPSALPDLGAKKIDPFSGAPFVYRLRADGFTLYSLGVNRTDDGGVDVRDEGRPADIVVRYPGGGSSL